MEVNSEPNMAVTDELDTKPINVGNISSGPRRSIVSSSAVEAAVLEENYETHHPHRGTAIVINHVQFETMSKREGSDQDRDAIVKSLEKLGFDIRVLNDLDLKPLHSELESIAGEDHSQNDCLVVVVMTHGEDKVLFAKDKSYPVSKLWDYFIGSACPTLLGKPKLFFVQACRGNTFDDGVKMMSKVVVDSIDARTPSEPLYRIIPNMADLLVMYSTYEGHYAWRNPVNGSWFIQTLSSELAVSAHKKELLQILTTVSRKVAFQFQSNVPGNDRMDEKKQMPCFVSTLTKALYFPPK